MAETQHDVTVIYEGTDITDDVDLIECKLHDVSRGAADFLDIKFDHAENWFNWQPRKNDRIQVKRGGFDSGTLYLNTIAPEDGGYRIYATGAKCESFPPQWQAFEDKSFGAILNLCAAQCAMGSAIYGVGSPSYEYLLNENMSIPRFLEQLAGRESAVLKTFNGKFTIIGVQYAQNLKAMHEVELEDDQMDSKYTDLRGYRWSSVKIQTPFGSGEARDGQSDGETKIITDLTVDNDAMAYRWARGILLMHNRQSEILTLEMDFNPGYTAMVRIDVKSKTDANGPWVIDEVEQDLLNGRTRANLYRSVSSIQ